MTDKKIKVEKPDPDPPFIKQENIKQEGPEFIKKEEPEFIKKERPENFRGIPPLYYRPPRVTTIQIFSSADESISISDIQNGVKIEISCPPGVRPAVCKHSAKNNKKDNSAKPAQQPDAKRSKRFTPYPPVPPMPPMPPMPTMVPMPPVRRVHRQGMPPMLVPDFSIPPPPPLPPMPPMPPRYESIFYANPPPPPPPIPEKIECPFPGITCKTYLQVGDELVDLNNDDRDYVPGKCKKCDYYYRIFRKMQRMAQIILADYKKQAEMTTTR